MHLGWWPRIEKILSIDEESDGAMLLVRGKAVVIWTRLHL